MNELTMVKARMTEHDVPMKWMTAEALAQMVLGLQATPRGLLVSYDRGMLCVAMPSPEDCRDVEHVLSAD